MVQQDCAGWLADIERDLPSVVFTAKDSDGIDLVDVEVSVDGQVLVTKLDGRAAPTNPGEHVFNFKLKDGTQRNQLVLMKEGEKNQRIAIILERRTRVPSPRQGAGDSPAVEALRDRSRRISCPPCANPRCARSRQRFGQRPGTGTWRTVGWVLGGVGVVGLGMGAVSGSIAVAKKNAAHCDANNMCDPGTSSGSRARRSCRTWDGLPEECYSPAGRRLYFLCQGRATGGRPA